MKKLLFSLLLLLCVTAAWAGPMPGGGYSVATLSELQAAINSSLSGNTSNANIKITADIDLSDLNGPLCTNFTGTIDGGYETTDSLGRPVIAPRILMGKRGQNLGSDHYLFEKVDGATISNLAFYNIRVDDEDNNNLGVIAREGYNTTFDGVMMLGVSVFCNKDNAGSFVGYAKECTFRNLRAFDVCVTTDGVAAGSFVGKSENSNFYFCLNNLTTNVFSDGRWASNYALAGGICGHSISDNFYDCTNFAWVGGNEDEVGGIVGRGMGSNFIRCVNRGYILQMDEENFQNIVANTMEEGTNNYTNMHWLTWTVIGTVAVTAIILSIIFPEFAHWIIGGAIIIATADGLLARILQNITFTGHDELGGIAGHAEDGSVEQCCNYGFYAAIHKYCGGIIGWAKNMTVNNCYVEHEPGELGDYDDLWKTTLMDKDYAGSIMGYASKCKITNCATPTFIASIGDVSDLKEGSGYVFRYESDNYDMRSYEMFVDYRMLCSGLVGYWLNNSPENIAAGIKPWRQNLTGSAKDICPRPDPTHGELCIDSLKNLYFDGIEPNVLRISEAVYLKNIAYNVNVNRNVFTKVVLENDLDMSNVEGMLPIGTPDNPFCGIFDGQGHTIKGMKIENDYAAGLFGYVGPLAIIENVILEDGEIVSNGDQGAGGIVGAYKGNMTWGSVLIRNCGSSANVTAPKHAGGIFGRFIPTKIDDNYDDGIKINIINCYNTGTVTATTDGNSGLIGGYMRNSAVVKNCLSAGKLLSGTSAKPYDATHNEFFVGYMDKADIENCYAIDPHVNVQGADESTTQTGVTNCGEDSFASGEFTYLLNGSTNDVSKSLSWQQEIGSGLPVLGNKGVYHTRTISNTIGTVCLPYALKSDEEVSYYRFQESKNEDGNIVLSFVSAENVLAGEPVLFRASNTGKLTFHGAGEGWEDMPGSNASPYVDWGIAGTYEQKVFDETTSPRSTYVYYISKGKVHNANEVTIAPYRAYLLGPSVSTLTGSGARISIMLDGEEDETSALELVYDYENDNENGNRSYTLFGTEAGEGYRGIVIRGGKKVIVNN